MLPMEPNSPLLMIIFFGTLTDFLCDLLMVDWIIPKSELHHPIHSANEITSIVEEMLQKNFETKIKQIN